MAGRGTPDARLAEVQQQLERARAEEEELQRAYAEELRRKQEAREALERSLEQLKYQCGEPVFLRDMDAAGIDQLVDEWVAKLRRNYPLRYKDAESVLGGVAPRGDEVRRLVEDLVLSLARNGVDARGVITVSFNMFINGDPQRGKSNLEAVMVLVVYFIHKSPKVKDRCYSLLGSVMIGWAEALFSNASDLVQLQELKQAFRAAAKDPEGDGTGTGGAPKSSQDDDEEEDDDDDDENEDEEGDNAQLEKLSRFAAELVLGRKSDKAAHQRQVDAAKAGGLLVFPRNINALKRINEIVDQVWREARDAKEVPPVHFVFLDEADQMRGSTARGADDNAGGRSVCKYELHLHQLFGLRRECGDGPVLRPGLVVDVSATNQLSFVSLLVHQRDAMLAQENAAAASSGAAAGTAAGAAAGAGAGAAAGALALAGVSDTRLQRKLLDIISFAEEPERYTGLKQCVAFKNKVLGDKQLTASGGHGHFVDDAVVGFYEEVISTPNACGLVVTSNRVSAKSNMDDHFMAASHRAVAKLKRANAAAAQSGDAQRNTLHVGVIVHGGEKVYKGCMGIYLEGAGRDIIITKINNELTRLGAPRIKPGKSLDQSNGKKNKADLCAEDLRPLLQELDDRSDEASIAALAAYNAEAAAAKRAGLELERPRPSPYKRFLQKLTPGELAQGKKPKRLSYVQLPLVLTLLRRLRPGVPVLVVGHGMVRRCLSIVGVHYLSADKPGLKVPTLVVTHMLLWATKAANGAGVVQQAGRTCHTLVEFVTLAGNQRFKVVQLLAPQLVWDFIHGGLQFNCWLGSSAAPGLSAAAAREKVVADVDEAVRLWVREGRSSVAFAVAIAEHLDMPDDVQRYLSYRGAVPPNAALPVKSFRDEMQEFLRQHAGSNYGVIHVRRNATPYAVEATYRLLLRTAPYTADTAPSKTDWLLGELAFATKAERDRAQLGGAAAAAAIVNTFLVRQPEGADWRAVQKRCQEAFEDAKEQSMRADGGFDAPAVERLAELLSEALLPGAPDDAEAVSGGAGA